MWWRTKPKSRKRLAPEDVMLEVVELRDEVSRLRLKNTRNWLCVSQSVGDLQDKAKSMASELSDEIAALRQSTDELKAVVGEAMQKIDELAGQIHDHAGDEVALQGLQAELQGVVGAIREKLTPPESPMGPAA